ncbi:PREDICTED: uncharacterized protein LOC105566160 [Vollenhovia emeryi]|uniref:uncharacterized protein LOC105566160 n=1 Tax=Vollenhovia emeryi TaxID=411798 RepID=UPI0005F4B18A|nr:PREDICTED: uncharacterized protein LOC105566160 [Vollenhovia emeryi]
MDSSKGIFFERKKERCNETKSGSGACKRRGFIYFENMKFIDKFVKTRSSMTNIKLQKKFENISNFSEDRSRNEEISNWVQHGKQTLEKERSPLKEIDANRFSPINKSLMSETTPTTSKFDDASCASFSENNTNDFVEQSSARSSPITFNSSLLSPSSEKFTRTFKKPSYMKGKFNPNISVQKDGKNRETENDNFEMSFINLNKAVAEHLNSKKNGAQMQNDPDASFCNLVMAELKQLDDHVKQIKKQEIMQILWRKENL